VIYPSTADGPVDGPTVYRAHAVIPVSAEMLAEHEGTRAAMDRWMAMSPAERAAAVAARQEERSAARLAAEAEARRFLAWLHPAVLAGPFAEAHTEIIEEHQPVSDPFDVHVCGTCAGRDRDGDLEGDPYPCITLRALAKAYGWSP